MSGTMIVIAFDDSPAWLAFDTGKRWNGGVVCMVTPKTRNAIVKWLRTMPESDVAADEIAALPPNDTGLIEIGDGLTLHEVEFDPCDDCGGPGTVHVCGRCGSTITVT